MMLRQIKAVEEGRDPMNVWRPPDRRRASRLQGHLCIDADGRAVLGVPRSHAPTGGWHEPTLLTAAHDPPGSATTELA